MFNHRQKTIGKSRYYIHEYAGTYWVEEIYNNITTARSKYIHHAIWEALEELDNIRVEGYYSDPSGRLKY